MLNSRLLSACKTCREPQLMTCRHYQSSIFGPACLTARTLQAAVRVMGPPIAIPALEGIENHDPMAVEIQDAASATAIDEATAVLEELQLMHDYSAGQVTHAGLDAGVLRARAVKLARAGHAYPGVVPAPPPTSAQLWAKVTEHHEQTQAQLLSFQKQLQSLPVMQGLILEQQAGMSTLRESHKQQARQLEQLRCSHERLKARVDVAIPQVRHVNEIDCSRLWPSLSQL